MGWGDFLEAGFDYGRSLVESKIGYVMEPKARVAALEEAALEARSLARQADLMGWHILDNMGSPHEMKPMSRIAAVKQAKRAWQNDPMAGTAVDLMNDFVFGRGVPPPSARNPDVQDVLDAAWNDPDNVAVLTGYMAQVALGVDLSLQSNLFILFFADGDDGKVKLSTLDHDTVYDVVRDPENRMRPLYYVASYSEQVWDFETDSLKPAPVKDQVTKQVRYYAHWKNVADAEAAAEAGLRDAPPKPPADKMGEGVVYHIAMNRTTEMVFGVPTMQRTLRWFSAYNDLMSARVDMAKAAAELIMKRKVKGTPTQIARMAAGAIGRGGEIATPIGDTRIGGLPGGTVMENENVTHEALTLDSGAGNATQDATLIRAQVSAGTRFPQHYLGDQGNANLATATAMDLPVTKMVESRQELFEQLFRAFADLVIERAVQAGQLQGDLPGEEDAEVAKRNVGAIGEAVANTRLTVLPGGKSAANTPDDAASDKLDGSPDAQGKTEDGKTDLSYEFKMPNALRRLANDLASTLQTIAKTFDPNGTNVELSRTLMLIALGDALEMENPADAVKRIFPEGYIDPLIKMELEAGQAQQQDPAQAQAEGVTPGGGQQRGGLTMDGLEGGGTQATGGEPGSGRRGPYGTKSGATPPEQVKEARFDDLAAHVQDASDERADDMEQEFWKIVGKAAEDIADSLPTLAATNGHV